jgi:hypothetical protein
VNTINGFEVCSLGAVIGRLLHDRVHIGMTRRLVKYLIEPDKLSRLFEDQGVSLVQGAIVALKNALEPPQQLRDLFYVDSFFENDTVFDVFLYL